MPISKNATIYNKKVTREEAELFDQPSYNKLQHCCVKTRLLSADDKMTIKYIATDHRLVFNIADGGLFIYDLIFFDVNQDGESQLIVWR